MARKSKLTPEQWEEIRKRVIAGEHVRALAKEFSERIGEAITEAAIRKAVKKPSAESKRIPVDAVKAAALQSVRNDLDDPKIRPLLDVMGDADRNLFHNHKADLLEITLQLNMASKYSAQNAHKLSRMAQTELGKMDEDKPPDEETEKLLRNAMAFQVASNEAAKQPMKLFEIATKQPPPPPEDKPIRVIGGLPDIPYD